MQLEKKDRLILINQYKILAKLDTNDANYYKELIQILENGYEIFYSLLDQWIDDEMPKEESRFVLDILDLYRAIEDLKRRTKDEELIQHSYSIFKGFDGNNESEHLGFTRFLIEIQGKFQEQKQYYYQNDHLNSHCPMLDKYRRMLAKVNKENIVIWQMNTEQALSILNA
ncbi:YfbU family protein [Acinetobacter sp. NIPH1876]|uniref:YfbU family protein n=1 Tax=Acinetobacter TaxID=469 RepID=UPI001F4ADD26|nr:MULTISPECIES: YfbU family protein [Acinetobacter]MCH7305898.1 YfbU family protein [Acinetobacter higginsii]MCH7339466.1 YfbU family protein [Acinetobacter higginsii]MCJ0827803.1 YfbU family protein [Acinetobacter sp. NIPH1876]